MGVAVDQARRDPATLAIDDLGARLQAGWHVGFRPGEDDAPVANSDRAMLHLAQIRHPLDEGREPCVAPDPGR